LDILCIDGESTLSKKRTTISVDAEVLEEAHGELNVSKITEKALEEAMSKKDYYFINSNRDNFDEPDEDGTDVYSRGVAVTYGPEKFGRKLEGIEPGDVIFHWVNEQGVRAEGIVTGFWDGEAVNEEKKVYDTAREYHLPTRWTTVLEEEEAVTNSELEEILGRGNPMGTKQKIGDGYDSRRLQEVVRGRAVNYS
jgi:hypothetical protein